MAASFIYTEEELANASAESKAAYNRVANEFLSQSRGTEDVIQIDDMLFRADSLREGRSFIGARWTNGEVFYAFDPAVTLQNQARWLDAAANWSSIANITFIPRTTEFNFIYVKNGTGNSSYVGMIGGSQALNMVNWEYEYIIVHEIGHALGMHHEQTRSDRDTYIEVHLENVNLDKHHNFSLLPTTNYTPYDFDSVMHYKYRDFTNNGDPVIVPKAPYTEWLRVIGQRDHLSISDAAGMAARYGNEDLNRTTFLSYPLNSDPGWTTEGQWAFGVPLGGGSHNGDPFAGYTGSNVYGYNLSGDYPSSMSEMSLTTTALDFSNRENVELRLQRWLGVESASFDHARIEGSIDGTIWTTVWENAPVSMYAGVWIQVAVDLSEFDNEPQVYIRWVMGVTDSSITYPGWNIDDVEFRGTALSPPPLPVVWSWQFITLLLIGSMISFRLRTKIF